MGEFYIDSDGFTDTTPEDAKKICKLLKGTYEGESRIDGYSIISLKSGFKKSNWNDYREDLQCELISVLVDHMYQGPPLPDTDDVYIKIVKHKPKVIKQRKHKLERILLDKLDKQNNRFLN